MFAKVTYAQFLCLRKFKERSYMLMSETATISELFGSRSTVEKNRNIHPWILVMPIKVLLFLVISATLFVSPLFAASHYVRSGASGSGNGSDWTNAYTTLPSSLIRGDVYYVAGGTYSGRTFR